MRRTRFWNISNRLIRNELRPKEQVELVMIRRWSAKYWANRHSRWCRTK